MKTEVRPVSAHSHIPHTLFLSPGRASAPSICILNLRTTLSSKSSVGSASSAGIARER